jgi:hypothetical protein
MDREIDLISQVICWGIEHEGVKQHNNPLLRLVRPKYNNERDVRLVDDEEDRLHAAAREEDRIQSRRHIGCSK